MHSQYACEDERIVKTTISQPEDTKSPPSTNRHRISREFDFGKVLFCLMSLLFAFGKAQEVQATTGTAAATVAIVKIEPSSIDREAEKLVVSDSFMHLADGVGARSADKLAFESKDRRLQVDVSKYDRIELTLTQWPADELMFLLQGNLEIVDSSGQSLKFGPGDSFVMPKNFSGRWIQSSGIKKISVSYATKYPPNPGETAKLSPSIVLVSADALSGTESKMQPVSNWETYLTLSAKTNGKYVEVPIFNSTDGGLAIHVKRFEAATFVLKNWPIDEFMYFRSGHVEIRTNADIGRLYGPGDAIVIPKGFNGTWRQLDTIDMVTAAYRRVAK